MTLLHETRKKNFLKILEGFRTKKEFAEAADIHRVMVTQISHETDPLKIGPKIAAKIEKAGGKPAGWLDVDHDSDLDLSNVDLKLLTRATSTLNRVFAQMGFKVEDVPAEAYEGVLEEVLIAVIKADDIAVDNVRHVLSSYSLKQVAV